MNERGAMPLAEASFYLGLGPQSDWLLDEDCPVPRCDIRKPGAKRASWVWYKADLDEFLQSRRVRPGETNPQEL